MLHSSTFLAPIARCLVSPLMYCQVLVQVGFLGETLVTSWFLANEWSFFGMDSEVVEEIVPLPEEHLASVKVAFKDFYLALSLRVFIFKHSELSGGGDLLLDPNLGEVEVRASLHVDRGVVRDLFSDFII